VTKEGATAEITPLESLTLQLNDVPLAEVLRIICSLTNLQYKVEEFVVNIFPVNETNDVMVVRTFPVPPGFFPSTMGTMAGVGELAPTTVSIKLADAKTELTNRGVEFPVGASATYLPKTAKLVIRNTLDQVSLVETLLGSVENLTKLIEIETRFVEFSDDKLKDVSFNWAYGKTLPSVLDAAGMVPPGGWATQAGTSWITEAIRAGTSSNIDFAGLVLSEGSRSRDGNNVGIRPRDYPEDGTSFIPNGGNEGSTALRTSSVITGETLDQLLGIGAARVPNSFALGGIVNGRGARLLINALESTIGVDLLSAPKLTVVNGQTAKIRSIREMRYPTEYEAPAVELEQQTGISVLDDFSSSSLTVTVTVPHPAEFEMRDVGVTLEVKATATADRRIDLELKPEITEFQGFINYGGPINASSTATGDDLDAIENTFTLTQGSFNTPVFSQRYVETNLQILDGQTVIMGGFIRDDTEKIKDKVPLLGDLPLVGRLFRSEAERSIKRNLVIFITARLMRADGRPQFLTEEESGYYGAITSAKSGG
jgi:general secretion pathway protein D